MSAVVNGRIDASWGLSGMDEVPFNTIFMTGASWSGGTAFIGFAPGQEFGLRVGEEIDIVATNPVGYQVTKAVITLVGPGGLQFALPTNPGPWIAGGAVKRVAPHNFAGGTKRIYRTITASGVTRYRFVAAVPIGDTTYADTVPDTLLGEELQTTDWQMPPPGLKALLMTPNGVMADARQRALPLGAEPAARLPDHRRLPAHRQLGHRGPGLRRQRDRGPDSRHALPPDRHRPGVAEWIKEENPYPGVSKRSIGSLPFGVISPSSLGLVFNDGSGSVLVSQPFWTEREWKPLRPETMIGAIYAGRYYAVHQTAEVGTGEIIILDRTEPAALTTANVNPAELWTDVESGNLYMVIDGKVVQWDGAEGEKMVWQWWSREEVLPRPVNFGWGRSTPSSR